MQKRVLRYQNRPANPSDISASFYPVSTAIVLRDQEIESFEDLTVMTTRTQGASATKEGRIEIMHARRLLFDDRISKEIVLNDTDIAAATQSTYFVQLLDRQYEQSLLREYQLTEIDSPLEYFFNFDHWLNSFRVNEESQPIVLANFNATQREEMGLAPTIRVEVTPLNVSHYLLRFDNLHDIFEQHKQNSYFLSLTRLSKHIENLVFKGKTPKDVGVII